MPQYTFYNEKTKEYKDIIMSMKEEHRYIDETGYEWMRVFYSPQAAIDTKIDPMSSKDWVNKTGAKRGSVGDLWNSSAEMSEKREKIMGKDTVKEKWYNKEKKKRKGKLLPSELVANQNKTFEI